MTLGVSKKESRITWKDRKKWKDLSNLCKPKQNDYL